MSQQFHPPSSESITVNRDDKTHRISSASAAIGWVLQYRRSFLGSVLLDTERENKDKVKALPSFIYLFFKLSLSCKVSLSSSLFKLHFLEA